MLHSLARLSLFIHLFTEKEIKSLLGSNEKIQTGV
jgi:hypothetical protein